MINRKSLGSGCAKCKRFEVVTRKVVESLGIEVEKREGNRYHRNHEGSNLG